MAVSAMPTGVLAASTGSSAGDMSLGEDLIQNAKTKYTEIVEGNAQTTVYLTVDEKNLVASLPTSVILSGTPDAQGKYIGKYSIKASGDMSGDKVINISPENNNVDVKQKGKINKSATITQIKTEFTTDDLKNSVQSEGTVTADKLTAGSWNGDFNFNVSTQKINHFYSSLSLAAQDINQTTMGTKNTVADLETAENAVCGVYRMGDTYRIELYKDLTEQESVTLDQNAALNLNEHTISFKKGEHLIYNKDLSVYNGKISGCNATALLYASTENTDSSFNIDSLSLDYTVAEDVAGMTYAVVTRSPNVNVNNLTINHTGTGSPKYTSSGFASYNTLETSVCDITNYTFTSNAKNCSYTRGLLTKSNLNLNTANISLDITGTITSSGIALSDTHSALIDNAKINVVHISKENNDISASGITGRGESISIKNSNIFVEATGHQGMGISFYPTKDKNPNQNALIENCEVFGKEWGVQTSPCGTIEIRNSKFSATDHSGYITGDANIYDSEFFIANRDKYTDIDSSFGLYLGSPDVEGTAVVNFTRCKINNGKEKAVNTVAAKRNDGYKSPRDVNFYDCELYHTRLCADGNPGIIFSYNFTAANNKGNTRFNLYGKTKILHQDGTEFNKQEITKMIAEWRQTTIHLSSGKYSPVCIGNILAQGFIGNVDENTGEIKAIYLTDDANVYDYRD